MSDCIFCKIVKGEAPADKVYEDDKYLAFLDITPVNHGHTLLISKEHYENLFDMTDEVLAGIAPLIKKIAAAVKMATDADGMNIGMNNNAAAGQIIYHSHIHIMPRYYSDGYRLWHGKSYDADKSAKIVEKIKKFL